MTGSNWFAGCATVEQVKARYRDLMKAHHPDVGGDLETCQSINAAMDTWAQDGMGSAFRAWRPDGRYDESEPFRFADILARVVRMDGIGRIEVIGHWVYCFDCFGVKDQLHDMGFQWSGKHRAWIYAGVKLHRYARTTMTTEQVRDKWGSTVVDKEQARDDSPAAAVLVGGAS